LSFPNKQKYQALTFDALGAWIVGFAVYSAAQLAGLKPKFPGLS
jgi:hypothetical protein